MCLYQSKVGEWSFLLFATDATSSDWVSDCDCECDCEWPTVWLSQWVTDVTDWFQLTVDELSHSLDTGHDLDLNWVEYFVFSLDNISVT